MPLAPTNIGSNIQDGHTAPVEVKDHCRNRQLYEEISRDTMTIEGSSAKVAFVVSKYDIVPRKCEALAPVCR